MFNSMLSAVVAVDSLILSIFIILGVVVAGAVIVYLLWEAVHSLVEKNKNSSAPITKTEKVKEKEETPVSEFVLEDENAEEKFVEVDAVKAEEERVAHDAELTEEERENAERRAYLEARRQELIKRMQAEMEESDDDEQTEDESQENEEVSEPVEESVETDENVAQETSVESVSLDEITEEAVENDESIEENQEESEAEKQATAEALAEERKALEAEKARYALMVRELEEAKRALAEQADKEPVTVVETVVETNNLTLEELEQRLAEAEERLKSTEKEFKQCKKEYIPLRRVWTAHEKDEKKLRRKEALVAKQKVLLYGVNNYSEIDEEKAQKLAEDLDLLDGLKLSVQHCEEVMKKNEERYPLLEKMYNVLKLRNDELKRDIAKYKAEIAKIQEGQTDAE